MISPVSFNRVGCGLGKTMPFGVSILNPVSFASSSQVIVLYATFSFVM